jgi:predicted Fe-Mo cluster-binding NifX family protein
MKICITSDGNNLKANVDPRFGRCAYFIIYDTETDNYNAIQNTNAEGMGGVGIKNATMIAEKGVEIIITGNIGPNASRVFDEFGIKVITGITGKIKDVIESFKKGNIK